MMHSQLHMGIDVGGTFTDLVAWDGQNLRIVKVPSTPPEFHRAVIEAVGIALAYGGDDHEVAIVHGSTVATHALLQRRGERVAFITTDGFADMLLLGRQNRPRLYALHPRRPEPIVASNDCFTVRERIGSRGEIVDPLDESDVARVIHQICAAKISHVAICLLSSFVNPIHEQQVASACRAAGLTVSTSHEILPEFREYERASTTAINATLRPIVTRYLDALATELPHVGRERTRAGPDVSIQIIHSAGGTLNVTSASEQAVRLVLSGPAGGVLGASFIARLTNSPNVITYDMGGTSTDVATIIDGKPRWTTSTQLDGLPIGVPMFDIHTIGAGGGSNASIDLGGALRVGPQSAGAVPGPACYSRGGTLPTVTDANFVLGRLPRDGFLKGEMKLDVDAAHRAIKTIAKSINRSVIDAALGIVRVAESNMAQAIRAVTSRRGHDPRDFALVSFGGAGGLHACALADQLEIPRVIVPPYCGVLSALGMVVAAPVVDVSQTVLHLGEQLDDDRLAAEFGSLSARSIEHISYEQTKEIEVFADVRFAGQSHEITVRVTSPSLELIRREFVAAYSQLYGQAPSQRAIEIVTLRLRRTGTAPSITLPLITGQQPRNNPTDLIDELGQTIAGRIVNRAALIDKSSSILPPLLIVDSEATTYVPADWAIDASSDGTIVLTRATTVRAS
jgi:N-methylhydantoinase A